MLKFGITEKGDAALNQEWRKFTGPKILITKNPGMLGEIPHNAIIHCTITGFGGTVLEPGVPKPEQAIKDYLALVARMGGGLAGDRVVLRVDPIIPTKKGLATAIGIMTYAESRIRISFIDGYPHVRARFMAAGLPNLPWEGLHAPLELRKEALETIKSLIGGGIEICGEPDLPSTGCISKKDYIALGFDAPQFYCSKQRPACRCLPSKQELLTWKGCGHGCLYCYWR